MKRPLRDHSDEELDQMAQMVLEEQGRRRDEARFWQYVNAEGEHWFWTANSHQFQWHGRLHRAGRVSWELHTGSPASDCAWVRATCGVTECIRPTHLRLHLVKRKAK